MTESTNNHTFSQTQAGSYTSDVTVIGLGMMGSTLARLLLDSGRRVTVWNRTAAKADSLVSEGATLAPDAAAAMAASPVIVVCVYDYRASADIFDTPEAEAAMAGRLLIQLTTGSPQEARDSEAWANTHGTAYLDGAIQAAPSQMGRPDTPLFISGEAQAFRQGEEILRVFGGGISYLGGEIGAASALDLASLSYIYGSIIGFFQGARIVEAEGFGVDRYADIVAGIAPTFADFLKHEGHVIHSGDFRVTESPLKISAEALDRISQHSQSAGIHDEFPALAAKLLRQAMNAGYGDEEIAALIKVFRRPQ